MVSSVSLLRGLVQRLAPPQSRRFSAKRGICPGVAFGDPVSISDLPSDRVYIKEHIGVGTSQGMPRHAMACQSYQRTVRTS
jgi:hypothetical protein